MTDGRNVRIDRDALNNVIVTGDGNVFYLFLQEPSEALLAELRAGQVKLADIAEAVPLPTLTLAIAFENNERRRWAIRAERPGREAPTKRTEEVPWHDQPGFGKALSTFWQLSRVRLERDEEHRALEGAAHTLGDLLAGALLPAEITLLQTAARGDPPPPLLVIESNDDLILALPWELLRIDGHFVVADGLLDVARSVPVEGAPQLGPPQEPVTLLVNVSAPEGSTLDYEAES